MEHLQRPRNAGKMAGADGVGEAGSRDCGAIVKVFIRFDGSRIGKAMYQAAGSSAVIAAGSFLTESVSGKGWREAAALSDGAIEAALGGTHGGDGNHDGPTGVAFAPGSESLSRAALFTVEALHRALEDSLRRGTFPRAEITDDGTVLVAMSGGVDSSTACLLEKHKGMNAIGVTMRLWGETGGHDGMDNSCCSSQAIQEARSVCHMLGVPHLTMDFRCEFGAVVVDNFTDEYISGRTPNPCVRCNGSLRFPALVKAADMLGAAKVATGHYARIIRDENGFRLARGVDRKKDQTYMLAAIGSELLPRLEFPLGEFTKETTRETARRAGIASHGRPESQDVCFIPNNNYRRFLRQSVADLPGNGDIVDTEGKILGVHSGYMDFTVGQRRGLHLGGGEPRYVVGIEPRRNLVVAGSRDQLAARTILINSVNAYTPPEEIAEAAVQVRYNSLPAAGRVEKRDGNRWLVTLDDAVYGVAPGQAAVLYRGDEVAACGVIEAADP